VGAEGGVCDDAEEEGSSQVHIKNGFQHNEIDLWVRTQPNLPNSEQLSSAMFDLSCGVFLQRLTSKAVTQNSVEQ